MINILFVLEVIFDVYEDKLKFDIVSIIDNIIINFNRFLLNILNIILKFFFNYIFKIYIIFKIIFIL